MAVRPKKLDTIDKLVMVSLGHATLVATFINVQSFGIRDYVSELSVVAVQELRWKNSILVASSQTSKDFFIAYLY